MSTGISTTYDVRFVNSFEEFDKPLEIKFACQSPDDVKNVVSALAAFYSGDPCECFINGEKAILENDWGLMEASHA